MNKNVKTGSAHPSGQQPDSTAKPRSKWAWLIVGVVVGLIVGIVALTWTVNYLYTRVVPTGSFVSTTSMNPVELYVQNREGTKRIKLRVPKAYLIDSSNWSGGRQDWIYIQAHVPSLRAFSVVRVEQQEKKALPDQGSSTLEQAQLDLRLTYYAFRPDYTQKRYEDIRKEYNNRLPDAHALERYQKKACPAYKYERGEKVWMECATQPDEVFISTPIITSGDPVYIKCLLMDQPGRAKCRAHIFYRGLDVQYVFLNSEIEHWKQFGIATRALLDTLIVEEKGIEQAR